MNVLRVDMMKAEKGSKVKVHYTGTLDDGTTFDSSEGKEPIEFVVGQNKVIPGFENSVDGMEQGEEKDFKLTPDQAYGERNEQLIQEVQKSQLPENMEVKEGQMLMLKAPNGQNLPAKVVEDKGETFMLDINHPLAGKNLNFKVKLDEVVEQQASEQEAEQPKEQEQSEEPKEQEQPENQEESN
ncbi:MAG: FKBP-type peptidyl-prolyl cis-trans isomerase [Nanobdellota archaeon]